MTNGMLIGLCLFSAWLVGMVLGYALCLIVHVRSNREAEWWLKLWADRDKRGL